VLEGGTGVSGVTVADDVSVPGVVNVDELVEPFSFGLGDSGRFSVWILRSCAALNFARLDVAVLSGECSGWCCWRIVLPGFFVSSSSHMLCIKFLAVSADVAVFTGELFSTSAALSSVRSALLSKLDELLLLVMADVVIVAAAGACESA
jgi:hypothetical protein